MAITDAAFDNEAELQGWAFTNIQNFFGDCIRLESMRITTPSGKHGLPDGFVFNLRERAWWVVECELLAHGVWPHIAEQVSRFVVAIRNSGTLRQIRDKLFDSIIVNNRQAEAAEILGTSTDRLLQQLELFIEGVAPSLAIFIDDTNQDLTDYCDALDISSQIYRIKKFIVNGRSEYYSPDKSQPAVSFENTPEREGGSSVFDVIERLGGGEVVSSRNKIFRLADGRVIKVQYSKLHERNQAFWYGISPSAWEQATEQGCTHFAFIMAGIGFVVVPVAVVEQFLANAYQTVNLDGTLRHSHVHISLPPNVVLKGYGNADDIDVGKYFTVVE